MSSSADAAADQTHTMMQDLADHWGLVVAMGVASVVLGMLAMFYPGATIVTVGIFFAAWLFVSRRLRGRHLVHPRRRHGQPGPARDHRRPVGHRRVRPAADAVPVGRGLHLRARHLLAGPGDHDLRGRLRGKQGRNWRLFSGILGVLAGIIILVYPITSAVTLAFIGGIWLVILGVTQIFAGFRLRRAHSIIWDGSKPA